MAIPLGPFDLTEPIGRGGMGEVWRGTHRRQAVPVAIKILSEERARQPEAIDAFHNEVRAIAGLAHPNIVMVLDHGEVDDAAQERTKGLLVAGSPYLAMELATGGSLAEIEAPLPWADVRHILVTLLDALAHAHARGVIHRDLKPGNVLLCTSADVRPGLKLSDFGIAAALEAEGEDADRVSGTLHYMAPEHILGRWRDHGPWTDLYALGCMAWRLASGKVPFEGLQGADLMRAQINDAPPPFQPRCAVPEGFGAWLGRMMGKRRNERFSRAADAAWALEQLGSVVEDRPSVLRDYLRATGPTSLAREHSTLAMVVPDDAIAVRAEPAAASLSLPSPGTPPVPTTWERPIPPHPPMQLVGAGLNLYGLRRIPFVGREAERDLLWGALRGVHMSGLTELVLVHGAAGTGKSRLVEWVCERGHELGIIGVLRIGERGDAPTDTLRLMVERTLRTVDLPRADVHKRVRKFLGDDPAVEALTELVRPATSAERRENRAIRPLETAEERYAACARFLQSVCGDRPQMLFVDDAEDKHDALGLCAFLLRSRAQRPLPILLVATVRDDVLADDVVAAARLDAVLRLPGAQRLPVGPLSPREHAELVQTLLGMEGSLAAQVEQRTRGNALFAVELVGDWVARGLLEVGPGGFEIRPGVKVTLPEDVRAEWSTRIDRLLEGLDPEAPVYLECAAALGLDVDMAEWRAVCPGAADPAGDESRRELVERMFAVRLALRRSSGWSFPNAMMRECIELRARDSGRWTQHHRRCAAMLRHRVGRGDPGMMGRLGRHLVAIGEYQEAIDTLLKGAEEIQHVGDQRAALALLATCEEAMAGAELPEEDDRWGRLWVARTTLLRQLRRMSEASHWCRRALMAARTRGWEEVLPGALREVAMSELRLGNREAARLLLEELEAWAADRQRTDLLATAHRGMGRVAAVEGRLDDARLLWHRAASEFDLVGDEVGLAGCYVHLATYGELSDTRTDALYRQAMDLFTRHNRIRDVAYCWNGLAEVARKRGDLKSAEQGYRQALELHDQTGNDVSVQQLNLALVHLRRGRFGEAHRMAESARRTLSHTGRLTILAGAHAALLPCMAVAGEWTAWDHHLRRARDLVKQTVFADVDLAWTLGLAGNLAARVQESERARAAYQMATRQYRQIGDLQGVADIEERVRRL